MNEIQRKIINDLKLPENVKIELSEFQEVIFEINGMNIFFITISGEIDYINIELFHNIGFKKAYKIIKLIALQNFQ